MYDAVVVGLGGVGAFALRALARGGKGGRFLGVERWSRGHTRGSSHGKTRIYRRAYFEHPSYVPWIEYSLSEFRKLEESRRTADDHHHDDKTMLSLMQECGTLLMAPSSSSTKLPPLLQASFDSAEKHGIPVEFLGPADLQERYPQFQYSGLPEDTPMVGLLEPEGGFLRPELVQEAALAEAEASKDVSIIENTRVLSIQECCEDESTSWVEVVLQSGDDENAAPETIHTRKLLVSAGAWTSQLVPSWAPHLCVIRQLQGWIDVSSELESDLFRYQNLPGWVLETPHWPYPLYGLPCDSDDADCRHWLKFSIHGRNDILLDPTVNATEMTVAEMDELERARVHGFNGRFFQSKPQWAHVAPCLYTMTPDCNYLLGVPQGFTNVFAVAGLSGHGFKMTPALGQMMADFALDQELAPWNMGFCSADRFSGSSPYRYA